MASFWDKLKDQVNTEYQKQVDGFDLGKTIDSAGGYVSGVWDKFFNEDGAVNAAPSVSPTTNVPLQQPVPENTVDGVVRKSTISINWQMVGVLVAVVSLVFAVKGRK